MPTLHPELGSCPGRLAQCVGYGVRHATRVCASQPHALFSPLLTWELRLGEERGKRWVDSGPLPALLPPWSQHGTLAVGPWLWDPEPRSIPTSAGRDVGLGVGVGLLGVCFLICKCGWRLRGGAPQAPLRLAPPALAVAAWSPSFHTRTELPALPATARRGLRKRHSGETGS